jgi:hypothetical protein
MVSIYQSGEWIENRLNNLMESSLKDDMEIWCVNADSPDPRDDAIPRKFPVKYVKLPKRNTVYEAWNYIINNSAGEFITNANTDDLIHPDGYKCLTDVLMKSGHDVGFAYPSWFTTNVPNQQWQHLTNIDRAGRPGHFVGDINTAGVGHFPVWRRTLHESVGLFDTRFRALADADWWARCHFVAKTQFRWVDDYLGCYLWRNGENLWHREATGQEWNLYHENLAKYRQGKLE